MNWKFLLNTLSVTCLFASLNGSAQKATSPKPGYTTVQSNPVISKNVNRPRLVVGIVVDQMRWDYLYRYSDRYSDGGFKRLLREGFSCENTLINYTPTITACGHTCIYTGSVPAIHGIIGNDWYSRELGRNIYCAEDSTVSTVGSTSKAGQMSPRNMLVTTIGDELRLSNNFQSKVVGVAIKDRGSILPAGHSATAAYWYDGSIGGFITSSYYAKELPVWVQNFNAKKTAEKYLSQPWNTLLPLNQYTESSSDDNDFENPYKGEAKPIFPHDLKTLSGGTFDLLRQTPFGNTFTKEFAIETLKQEKMGQGNFTDFLALSFSSTDSDSKEKRGDSKINRTYLMKVPEIIQKTSFKIQPRITLK